MMRVWFDVATVMGWFLLAFFVMFRLLTEPDQIDTTLAAWTGGVLSVFFAQLLYRLFKHAR